MAAPSLTVVEARVARDERASDFGRIEHWYLALSRELRRAGVPLLPPLLPHACELAMHPAELDALRRWMLADVLEARPATIWRDVLVGALWHCAGPTPEVSVARGTLVHTARLGSLR